MDDSDADDMKADFERCFEESMKVQGLMEDNIELVSDGFPSDITWIPTTVARNVILTVVRTGVHKSPLLTQSFQIQHNCFLPTTVPASLVTTVMQMRNPPMSLMNHQTWNATCMDWVLMRTQLNKASQQVYQRNGMQVRLMPLKKEHIAEHPGDK